MSGQSYHYQRAESYLAGAAELRRQGLTDKAMEVVAIAQVHATLAAAAGWWDGDGSDDLQLRHEPADRPAL